MRIVAHEIIKCDLCLTEIAPIRGIAIFGFVGRNYDLMIGTDRQKRSDICELCARRVGCLDSAGFKYLAGPDGVTYEERGKTF